MALDKTVLSGLIIAKLTAEAGVPVIDPAWLAKFADGMADAIVTHLITSGQCLPGSFTVSGFGPVTGVGQIE